MRQLEHSFPALAHMRARTHANTHARWHAHGYTHALVVFQCVQRAGEALEAQLHQGRQHTSVTWPN
eukprot:11470735-Alexandrium_andersonii.AAC.1